jgi:Family of unknown function (DUF6491)
MTRFTFVSPLRSLVLAGLAATAITAPASAECVRLVNVHGYSVIDNQHLVLNGGASRHYLVTTRQRCPDMRFGARIGTSFDNTETICSPRFEYLLPEGGYRCSIDTIEQVESVEAAQSLIAERAEMDERHDIESGGAN